MPSSHDIPRIPLRTVGPYQLTAQLGQSTHGPAYIARIPGNDTTFSLKWFQRRIPPEEVARIRQEIQIVSRLNHPGIVVPVDFGLEKDRLYIVSEHVEGSTAQERLSTHGPMDTRDAARLVADLADALERAHQAGILHRDLKPANVIVDARNRGRILDLGLGPSVSAAGTNTTPYQSPEQIRGERPGVRTDVYALGAILYELLCCRPPYSGRSTQELADTILAGQLIPPRRLTAGIDPKVESLCLSALSASPRKRPSSAAALAKSLRRAAEGSGGSVPLLLVALIALIWLLSLAIPITLAVKYSKNLDVAHKKALTASQDHTKKAKEFEQQLKRSESRADQAEATLNRLKDDKKRLSAEVGDLKRKVTDADEQLQQFAQVNRQLSVQALEPLGRTAVALDSVIDILDGVESVAADRLRVDLLRARGRYPESADLARALRTDAKPDYDLAMSEYLSAYNGGNLPRLGEIVAELRKAPSENTAAHEFAALGTRKSEDVETLRELSKRIQTQGTTGHRYLDQLALTNFHPGPRGNPEQARGAMVIVAKLLPGLRKSSPLEPSYLRAAIGFHGMQAMAALRQKRNNVYADNLRAMMQPMRLSRELQPENLNMIIEHAQQYLVLGRSQEALGLYDVAIRHGDRMARLDVRQKAQVGKGSAYIAQKQFDEGLRQWKGVFGTFGSELQQSQASLIANIYPFLRELPQEKAQEFVKGMNPAVGKAMQQIWGRMAQAEQQQQQQQQRPR